MEGGIKPLLVLFQTGPISDPKQSIFTRLESSELHGKGKRLSNVRENV